MSCRRDGIAIDLVLTDIVHGPVHRPISSVSQTFFTLAEFIIIYSLMRMQAHLTEKPLGYFLC